MRRNIFITIIALLSFSNFYAQLPNGSVAPDFSLTDINGTHHQLYDYLDNGYTVFLDFSAVWCGPCWSYHQSGALEDLYVNHGPSGMPNVSASTTDDVMVFFIEGDGSALTCLQGTGCGTQGDWVSGTPYPIICTDGTVNGTAVTSAYSIGYWPTIYQICPDRLLTEAGQASNPYQLAASCLPPPAFDIDARSFLKPSAASSCSDITPEIYIQNYGFDNLTSVTIDVSVNGVFQYTTIYNQTWNSVTQSMEPLDLATLEIDNVILNPLYDLSNNDVIEIDVYLPNGQTDSDPSNNQTILLIVELGFDNAYWDAPLSIDVSGTNGNSWYLKKVSNNLIIASGFGGAGTATNFIPLEFDECYSLQSIANEISFTGASYTITDGNGQIVLQGTTSNVEEFDNFSTGAEVWTGIEDVISQNINIYPNPVLDNLFIQGSYDNLQIFDLLGRSLLVAAHGQKMINVDELVSGVYIVEINSGDKINNYKIQVRK